jgi:hypothetical protein
MIVEERTPLHLPELHLFEEQGLTYVVDGSAPNWAVLEPAGRDVLRTITQGGGLTAAELTAWYAAATGFAGAKAWLHIHDFLRLGCRLYRGPAAREV